MVNTCLFLVEYHTSNVFLRSVGPTCEKDFNPCDAQPCGDRGCHKSTENSRGYDCVCREGEQKEGGHCFC